MEKIQGDTFSEIFKKIGDSIEWRVKYLRDLARDMPLEKVKIELKKKFKLMRIYKILEDDQIKNKISDINEVWYNKLLAR